MQKIPFNRLKKEKSVFSVLRRAEEYSKKNNGIFEKHINNIDKLLEFSKKIQTPAEHRASISS